VLFLCTANYYRSRLSELLFRFHAERLGLDWDTDSKGILDRMRGMGLSPTATRYLEKLELGEMAKMPREPAVASLEDIMETHLVVALNRAEHEPLLRQRFGRIPVELEKTGRLRYWNVFDVPSRTGLSRIFSWGDPGSQPEDSSTEHVNFAVQSLVHELLSKEKRAEPSG
jgi:protein-tyrosine phosphatase